MTRRMRSSELGSSEWSLGSASLWVSSSDIRREVEVESQSRGERSQGFCTLVKMAPEGLPFSGGILGTPN